MARCGQGTEWDGEILEAIDSELRGCEGKMGIGTLFFWEEWLLEC